MRADDRRFASTLALIVGPLFMLGGFLAAFTIEGALFVHVGLGMLLTGVLLRTRIWASIAATLGLVLCVMLSTITIMDYSR